MAVEIKGITALNKALKSLAKRISKEEKPSVTTGFTQRYALIVHEDLEAKHTVGESKYLEKASNREQKGVFEDIISHVKTGGDLETALFKGGLRIQRAAQKGDSKSTGVPIDTSALKASGFTAKTKDLEAVATEAFERSETVRLASKGKKK